jgi:hypothetical protein
VYDISDSEFAEKAQNTCNKLLGELKQIYATNPNAKEISVAYRQAAKALGELHYTAQSAPFGYQLRTNMAQYAEVLEEYRSSYDLALSETGITGVYLFRVETDYTIIILDINSGDALTLDIDSELVQKYHTSRDAFLEAASELGLEGCAVKESDLKN